MKLFEVENGYIGFGVVKCFVIAENEDRAIENLNSENKHLDLWTTHSAICYTGHLITPHPNL